MPTLPTHPTPSSTSVPELPEVESVRRGLAERVVGAQVIGAEVYRDSCVRRLSGGPAEFRARIVGATLGHAVRRGKFLWFELREGNDEALSALSAHLGMSGQFRVHRGEAPEPHPHCRARLTLSSPGAYGAMPLALDFVDQRTFGYLDVERMIPTLDGLPGGQGSDVAGTPRSVAHIGRDALDPALGRSRTLAAWRRGGRGIKQLLLDQSIVSGIGNIYADEALWRARVHPGTLASALSGRAAGALLDAVREVMTAALAAGGTSFDALYVNVNGESGYFSRELDAYGRGGEPCRRCGRPLERAVMGGRSTHWCGRCQRPPRTSGVPGAATRAR